MSKSWEQLHLEETICYFPKYRGETWWEVCQKDASYVQWVVENIEDLDEELRDALEWGIGHAPERM